MAKVKLCTQRNLLIALAVTLCAIDFTYLLYKWPTEKEDFEIALTEQSGLVSKWENDLPVYDDAHHHWLLRGKEINSLNPFLRPFSTDVDKIENIGPFLLVRLPENSNMLIFRHALLSLEEKGICRIGVASNPSSGKVTEREEVHVFKIRWLRTDVESKKPCRDGSKSS